MIELEFSYAIFARYLILISNFLILWSTKISFYNAIFLFWYKCLNFGENFRNEYGISVLYIYKKIKTKKITIWSRYLSIHSVFQGKFSLYSKNLLWLFEEVDPTLKVCKCGFISEGTMYLSNLQKNECKITLLSRKFEFPAHNSKQLRYSNFLLRRLIWPILLEIWQTHHTFWQKATFNPKVFPAFLYFGAPCNYVTSYYTIQYKIPWLF